MFLQTRALIMKLAIIVSLKYFVPVHFFKEMFVLYKHSQRSPQLQLKISQLWFASLGFVCKKYNLKA